MIKLSSNPKFKATIKKSTREITKEIYKALKTTHQPIQGKILSSLCVLNIKKIENHFWSPQLIITIESKNNETELIGSYGPKPTIWVSFFVAYILLGIALLFLLIFGLAKYSLHQSSFAFVSMPLIGILFFILYSMAKTGQKLAESQTLLLHTFIEQTLNLHIKLE